MHCSSTTRQLARVSLLSPFVPEPGNRDQIPAEADDRHQPDQQQTLHRQAPPRAGSADTQTPPFVLASSSQADPSRALQGDVSPYASHSDSETDPTPGQNVIALT